MKQQNEKTKSFISYVSHLVHLIIHHPIRREVGDKISCQCPFTENPWDKERLEALINSKELNHRTPLIVSTKKD